MFKNVDIKVFSEVEGRTFLFTALPSDFVLKEYQERV